MTKHKNISKKKRNRKITRRNIKEKESRKKRRTKLNIEVKSSYV
jgi:hypothetical protein